MAKFWLVNSARVGTVTYYPGTPFDDAIFDTGPVLAAGGYLFPQGTALVDAAAALCTVSRARKGANEVELAVIMQTAINRATLASEVPITRTIATGTGLTGGGDLSADRTFDVGANADGSIVVNANDVQVGVLATDAQHGVRGGGTQHSNAVAAGAAGFMTGADKTKLDNLPGSGSYTGQLVGWNGTAWVALTAEAILSNDKALQSRNFAGSGALPIAKINASDQLHVGGAGLVTTIFDLDSGGSWYFRVNATTDLLVVDGGAAKSVAMFTNTPAYGGGVGVLALAAATTAPTGAPASGVVVYVDPADGHLKAWKAGEVAPVQIT